MHQTATTAAMTHVKSDDSQHASIEKCCIGYLKHLIVYMNALTLKCYQIEFAIATATAAAGYMDSW